MLFLLPFLILLLTALALLVLDRVRPQFKFAWLLALAGAVVGFAVILLWQLKIPVSFSLPVWQPVKVFKYTPTWSIDGISFPYSLSLLTLTVAIILTSIVRNVKRPMPWSGTLFLTALGILAVSAGDPLTLILAWTAIDLAELVTMLRSSEGENQVKAVIIAFSVRLVGTGLVIWAAALNSSAYVALSFERISENAGIYLLFASGLRLGVLPLHLPYRSDALVRRGFGTSLRLVSASASLALLARVPPGSLAAPWAPWLLLLAAIPALYASWMWLRASDELVGRPFWVLGMASLAVASALLSSPQGSISWGIVLVLGGGLIFLYSSRHRTVLWIPLLALWGLSALPYSPSASAWIRNGSVSWLFMLPFLPAQALFMAGLFRHVLHPGETSFESQERWARILYPAGLILLAGTLILLGFWGWTGAMKVGAWWLSLPVVLLAMVLVFLARRPHVQTPPGVSRWADILHLDPFYKFVNFFVRLLENLVRLVTSTLEGEGGIFWSILLLVLILSLLILGGSP